MTWSARWMMLVVAAALLAGCSASKGVGVGRTTTLPSVATSDTTASGVTSSGPSSTFAQTSDPAHGTTSAPAHGTTSSPSATAPPVNTTGLPAPPPASTGRGRIAGHVYAGCGNGQPSGGACQSRLGIAGDTIVVKSGETTIASTVSGADGSYHLDVPAGLHGLSETKGRQSTRVQVDAGLTVVADFTVS